MSHHEHDLGLSHDLPRIVERNLGRRGLLALVGGLGVAAVAGCGADAATSGTAATSTQGQDTSDTSATASGEIPEETAGPFPGDGSNGPDVLGESGVVRSDITRSFGSASGVAEGVPLTIRLKVYDLNGADATVLPGAAVYAWHADREGRYSMYDDEIADQNYLRGVQAADDKGWVEFASTYPACYDGRWPHVHFEVYRDLAAATSGGERLRTSQLAFPEDVCAKVYATDGYEQSVSNLSRVSLDTDMVFSDGHSLQMATMTGSNDEGWTATLNVPV
jgi:protocatechuate 3,4-dioxygenase beta subunit